MSSWNFVLSWDEHEKSFITSGLILLQNFSVTCTLEVHHVVYFDFLRPINNISVIKGRRVFLGWTSTKLGLMCLAQWHNAVTPVRLEPAAHRSRSQATYHSATAPHTRRKRVERILLQKLNSFNLFRLFPFIVLSFFSSIFRTICCDIQLKDVSYTSVKVWY